MRDEITQLTSSVPGAPGLQKALIPANRTKLAPVAKLTRAHLAVARRPAVVRSLVESAQRAMSKVAPQLKTTLSLEPTLLSSTLHPFSHLAPRALYVTLALGGDALGLLELDLLATGAVLAKITGGQEPVSVLTRLSSIEEAALGWTLLTTLAELRAEAAFAAFQPRLVAITLDRGDILRELDARQRYVAVQLAITIGGLHCLSRLLIPAAWVQAKFDALPVEPSPALQDTVAQASLDARCLLGTAQLSPKDYASLAVKDVVVFAGVTKSAEGLLGPARLVGSAFELRGQFTATGFTPTRVVPRITQEIAMSQPDPTVPVEVEIELTRVRLPLHQLGNVHTGAVIPLHINAAQQVVLRIGDKAIARAELVEVEGEIGARIVAML
ncbi:MAG TPA: FliM/FliN family flagellar motor switch protein [Archangium sp.]